MRKPVFIAVGVLIAIMGTTFFFQGIGVIGGSVMTDSTLWAVLGPIIAIAGLGLVAFGLRGRKET